MNKRMKITSLLSLAAGFLLVGAIAQAQVPQLLNYQGVLKDGDGNLITGEVSILFSIYDVSSSGTALWSETQNPVKVTGGLFNVLLGANTAEGLPTGLFYPTYALASFTDRYLGVNVNNDGEMSPRQKLVSVSHALKAEDSDTLGDGLVFTDTPKTKVAIASPLPPIALLDVGGWAGIPGDIALSGGANMKGDLFIGTDGPLKSRTRISSNSNRGFLQYNSYWNGSNQKSMDSTNSTLELSLDGTRDLIEFKRMAPTSGPFNEVDFTILMRVNSSGNVTANSFSSPSSRELKKDIMPLRQEDYQDILEEINGIQMVRFLYKEEENRQPHLGVIAEESPQQILDSSGKAVSLADYTSFLLAGMKAQSEQIKALTEKIEALEAKQVN